MLHPVHRFVHHPSAPDPRRWSIRFQFPAKHHRFRRHHPSRHCQFPIPCWYRHQHQSPFRYYFDRSGLFHRQWCSDRFLHPLRHHQSLHHPHPNRYRFLYQFLCRFLRRRFPRRWCHHPIRQTQNHRQPRHRFPTGNCLHRYRKKPDHRFRHRSYHCRTYQFHPSPAPPTGPMPRRSCHQYLPRQYRRSFHQKVRCWRPCRCQLPFHRRMHRHLPCRNPCCCRFQMRHHRRFQFLSGFRSRHFSDRQQHPVRTCCNQGCCGPRHRQSSHYRHWRQRYRRLHHPKAYCFRHPRAEHHRPMSRSDFRYC